MSTVPTLKAMGWGLGPIYVGQQAVGYTGSHTLTAAQGTADAANAVSLAAILPAGSVIYLDIEQYTGTLAQNFISYITAWVAGFQGTIFEPGIYCWYSVAAQVSAAIAQPIPIWVFRQKNTLPVTTVILNGPGAVSPQAPSASGFAAAIAWQFNVSGSEVVNATWTDTTGATQTLAGVDIDTSTVPDPSNPQPAGGPAVTGVDPGTGLTAGGTTVSITGTGFTGATAVQFGSTAATEITLSSENLIIATSPPGTGTVSVSVTTPAGTAAPNSDSQFT